MTDLKDDSTKTSWPLTVGLVSDSDLAQRILGEVSKEKSILFGAVRITFVGEDALDSAEMVLFVYKPTDDEDNIRNRLDEPHFRDLRGRLSLVQINTEGQPIGKPQFTIDGIKTFVVSLTSSGTFINALKSQSGPLAISNILTLRPRPDYQMPDTGNIVNLVATSEDGSVTFIVSETAIGVRRPSGETRWFRVVNDLIYNPSFVRTNYDGSILIIGMRFGIFVVGTPSEKGFCDFDPQDEYAESKLLHLEPFRITDRNEEKGPSHQSDRRDTPSFFLDVQFVPGSKELAAVAFPREVVFVEVNRRRKPEEHDSAHGETRKVGTVRVPSKQRVASIRFAPTTAPVGLRSALFYSTTVGDVWAVPDVLDRQRNKEWLSFKSGDARPVQIVSNPQDNISFDFLKNQLVFAKTDAEQRVSLYRKDLSMWDEINPLDQFVEAVEQSLVCDSSNWEKFRGPITLWRVRGTTLLGHCETGLIQVVAQTEDRFAVWPLILSTDICGFGGDLFCIVLPGYHVALPSSRVIKEMGKEPIMRLDPREMYDESDPVVRPVTWSMNKLLREVDDRQMKLEKAIKESEEMDKREEKMAEEIKREMKKVQEMSRKVEARLAEFQRAKIVKTKGEQIFAEILDHYSKVVKPLLTEGGA